MEIYKIVSFCFVPLLLVMALVLNKSITLGLMRPVVVVSQVISFIGMGWAFFSIINLFGWWSLLVIPITWGVVLFIVAGFLDHLRTMDGGYSQGEELLMGQGGYGALVVVFFVASLTPYLLHWFMQ